MIVVVSYPGEDHADAVVPLLQAEHDVVRIDLADFPSQSTLTLSWNHQEQFVLSTSNGPVDISQARAVWWRRVRPFGVGGSHEHEGFVASETQAAVLGMLDALPATWVNPRQADAAAHHKPLQWTVARSVGLSVPDTLVTTDPAAAEQFVSAHGVGRVVYKAFLAAPSAWRETRLVQDTDLERLSEVRAAPVIFQEYVPGVDLRVTIVGNQVFAAAIDARSTSYPVDMRLVIGEAAVELIDLPNQLTAALLALMARLGLVYGAVDLRRRPDGRYEFLEVNPAGQWLFIEDLTGAPISAAVAALLGEFDQGS